MKKIITVILLLTTCTMFSQLSDRDAARAQRYKSMKTAGMIMIPAGGILAISGAVITISAYSEIIANSNNPNAPDNDVALALKAYGGELMIVLGAGCIAGGTVMFLVAKRKLKRLENSKVSFYVAPTAFKLTYRF